MSYGGKQRVRTRKKYKITNWTEYNEALKKRGSLTVWIAEDTRDNWYVRKPEFPRKGRRLTYTDQAIETLLTLRLLFRLPLRQTTGFCESLFELVDISLTVPEYSRLSRRGSKSILKKELPSLAESEYIVIDSTSLLIPVTVAVLSITSLKSKGLRLLSLHRNQLNPQNKTAFRKSKITTPGVWKMTLAEGKSRKH